MRFVFKMADASDIINAPKSKIVWQNILLQFRRVLQNPVQSLKTKWPRHYERCRKVRCKTFTILVLKALQTLCTFWQSRGIDPKKYIVGLEAAGGGDIRRVQLAGCCKHAVGDCDHGDKARGADDGVAEAAG
jgi:hypothetical protein